MIRRPPRSTRTDTLFPYTTLFRSVDDAFDLGARFPQRLARLARDKIGEGVDPAADGVREAPQRLDAHRQRPGGPGRRSEEHTSELQSLMRISYAVFCLKKKKNTEKQETTPNQIHTDTLTQNT